MPVPDLREVRVEAFLLLCIEARIAPHLPRREPVEAVVDELRRAAPPGEHEGGDEQRAKRDYRRPVRKSTRRTMTTMPPIPYP
jgi:hypothetical protein